MAKGDRNRDFEAAATEVARQVTRMVSQGADVVEAYLSTKSHEPSALGTDKARQKALDKHERAVRKYEKSLVDTRHSMRTLQFVSLGLGTGGVVDLFIPALQGPTVGLFIGSFVTGLISIRKRMYLRDAQPPKAPALPSPTPPRLDATAIGYAEAERYARVRRELLNVMSSVSAIHPDAGRELAEADNEAGPALTGLVQRLAVLSRITSELHDTQAAAAAARAAEEVRARLSVGVQTYEQLLAAAATMLAAPDLSRSSDQVLTPAIEALAAYAHGLAISADTFGQGELPR